jgi:hypothetical protein
MKAFFSSLTLRKFRWRPLPIARLSEMQAPDDHGGFKGARMVPSGIWRGLKCPTPDERARGVLARKRD